MSHISIVIVNWNTGPLLARCLASLKALPVKEQQQLGRVVVVDNASIDDSVAEARRVAGDTPLFEFLEPGENLGFAKGNNVGIRALAGTPFAHDHIWLLNPDTEVKPGAVTAQQKILAEQERAGIIGAHLKNPDNSHQDSVRPFPKLTTFVLYGLKLGHRVTFPQIDVSREQEVDQVMGASLLIRAETLQEVGVLDEHFFVWFEEVDYCKRAKQAGWRVVYTPKAEVIHHGGASFHQLTGFRKALPWLKSSLYYTQKHFGWGAWAMLVALAPITLLLTLPATLRHSVQKAQP